MQKLFGQEEHKSFIKSVNVMAQKIDRADTLGNPEFERIKALHQTLCKIVEEAEMSMQNGSDNTFLERVMIRIIHAAQIICFDANIALAKIKLCQLLLLAIGVIDGKVSTFGSQELHTDALDELFPNKNKAVMN